ncbi:MAG: hypothetical protein ABFS56_29500 [Pseudomonadota bacterium]
MNIESAQRPTSGWDVEKTGEERLRDKPEWGRPSYRQIACNDTPPPCGPDPPIRTL